jgi:hypothetical protein
VTPQKLAHMFKGQFNYCAIDCSELMWIDKNQMEDKVYRKAKISLVKATNFCPFLKPKVVVELV